jgi:hypothetical protein
MAHKTRAHSQGVFVFAGAICAPKYHTHAHANTKAFLGLQVIDDKPKDLERDTASPSVASIFDRP